MAWDKGFNFRASSGYVTDPADCTYATAGDTYPVTRNSVTFGWTVSPTSDRDRAAYTGDQAKLAGLCFGNSNGTFQVDLPSAGSYDIRLAVGDAITGQSLMNLVVLDNATPVITLASMTTSDAQWYDASGVLRTSAADWVANNVAVNCSFSSTTLFLQLGAAASNTTIAHLFISQTAGAPAGNPWHYYAQL